MFIFTGYGTANRNFISTIRHQRSSPRRDRSLTGCGSITAALTQLARWRRDQEISNRDKETSQPTSEARHLQPLILMISEAARFPEIEQTIANALDGTRDSPLKPEDIQKLTHQWGELSGRNDLESLKRVGIRTKSR
jgi:hypothetical protein